MEDRLIAFKYTKGNLKMEMLLGGEEPYLMMEVIVLDNTILMPLNLQSNMIKMENKFTRKFTIYFLDIYFKINYLQ